VADRAPLAVLVGGAPGSGKTTLAEALAVGLDLPVLHKGPIGARAVAHSEQGNRARRVRHPTILSLHGALDRGGHQLRCRLHLLPIIGESEVARRLAPRSTLVNVHCRSLHSFERWEQRMRNDPLCGETRLQKLVPVVERLNSELHEPLDFGCPSVVVNTDNGYQPTLDAHRPNRRSIQQTGHSRPRQGFTFG
jgi:hypothetical protein